MHRILDHAPSQTSVMIHNPNFRRTLIGPHETDTSSLSPDKAPRRGRFPPQAPKQRVPTEQEKIKRASSISMN
ncbi:hypothetical protein EMEDMD4_40025 [Sinorhizobium medicae]|uniref:Uncharacterized protein n=1 Tax=Sinorhizobium medicae TaxID=110321 RepID=A0A508WYD7_9HYPH|nr:hypothetical protein EMEDMD4_40025 [Sinorhizobium medicae]